MTEQEFMKIVKKVMEHNQMTGMTVEECDKNGLWTPIDLIIREYLNNGGGSANGFLGIRQYTCVACYDYICEHKQELIDKHLINQNGYNNFGIPLWKNYDFERK